MRRMIEHGRRLDSGRCRVATRCVANRATTLPSVTRAEPPPVKTSLSLGPAIKQDASPL
jgi:hypothetical protein